MHAIITPVLACSCSLETARMLGFSLILLCSYFLYVNDKSFMIWLTQKVCNILICTSGISVYSTVNLQRFWRRCLIVLLGKLTKLHNKHFVYWFIQSLSYFILAGFLLEIGAFRCSQEKFDNCSCRTKLNTLLACEQRTFDTRYI